MENLSIDDSVLKKNIEIVQENVRKAAQSVGRNFEDITILAATKMQNVDVINRAVSYGIAYIGENRVQELMAKYDGYNKEHISIQYIGHLQVNKVKYIVDKVDMIQSVDSMKLAAQIDKYCARLGKIMDVLIEVNIGKEENKHGVFLEDLVQFLTDITYFKHVRVRGLMTIPPICDNIGQTRQYFSSLYKEFLDIRAKKIDNIYMDFLSMGMSGDYMCAVECGANIIRIGTALFGSRKKQEE